MGETRALIGGGGGEYSYIRVLPDEFLLKLTLMTADFKRNSSGRTRRYEYSPPPPPPINVLVSPLIARLLVHAVKRTRNYVGSFTTWKDKAKFVGKFDFPTNHMEGKITKM